MRYASPLLLTCAAVLWTAGALADEGAAPETPPANNAPADNAPSDEGAPTRRAPEAPSRTPRYRGNPTCAPVCAPAWDRCVARCGSGYNSCVEACESEHRTCMRGCL